MEGSAGSERLRGVRRHLAAKPRRRILAVALCAFGVLAAGLSLAGCSCSPLPTPSPEPEPPAVWPLTGEQAGATDDVSRRAVSVKVENSTQSRPQAGLADADIVYELLTEGGITRFHAVYHSGMPGRVGPVRSARPPDVRLVRQYGTALVYSGANRIVQQQIAEAEIDALDEDAAARSLSRDPGRRRPHNLYADLRLLPADLEQDGYATALPPRPLEFGSPSAEGTSAPTVEVTFNARNRVVWTWESGAGRYERTLNGEPQGDEAGDGGWRAANVVVLFAQVVEGEREGTTDVLLDTSGEALLFRDGLRYEAAWQAAEESPPRLVAADGSGLPLATGPTWFEVLPAWERSNF